MELIKVVRAKYIEGYKIEFQFNNGIIKTIDLSNEIYGEVFEPLKNLEYFKKFSLNPFTIEWENGADFAPDYLYKLGN
ncbi:MAG: DUF2442 domain-containing protein [Bacteroidales bacterium]|nr:DUF2442 domain-containing protein [Bacteroidales bacterium]